MAVGWSLGVGITTRGLSHVNKVMTCGVWGLATKLMPLGGGRGPWVRRGVTGWVWLL